MSTGIEGYGKESHLDVEVVCTICHKKRTMECMKTKKENVCLQK